MVGVIPWDRGWLADDAGVAGRGAAWLGDVVDTSDDAVPGRRSERELLRFRRTFTPPRPRTEETEPVSSCALFGLWKCSCEDEVPNRSREPGRRSDANPASTSIDLDRRREPLGVPGSESPAEEPLLLLRVRKMCETLLSPSGFELLSR